MLLLQHRDGLLELTRDAYLARFAAMTSTQSLPRRYYVFHEDTVALEDFAADEPSVLKIAATRFDRLAAVDIQRGQDGVVEEIRLLGGVRQVFKGGIPLFCH